MTPTPSRKLFPLLKSIELADPNYFLYFAYGSNLLKERIHVANPSAEFVAVGKLPGYSLGFFGDGLHSNWKGAGATIYPNNPPGAYVYGVLWRLHEKHSQSLDLQESCYRRITVDVQVHDDEMNGCHDNECCTIVKCRTYQRLDNMPQIGGLPSPHYMKVIITGAVEHNLPEKYVELLKSFPDNGYSGAIGYKLKALEGFLDGK